MRQDRQDRLPQVVPLQLAASSATRTVVPLEPLSSGRIIRTRRVARRVRRAVDYLVLRIKIRPVVEEVYSGPSLQALHLPVAVCLEEAAIRPPAVHLALLRTQAALRSAALAPQRQARIMAPAQLLSLR